MATVVEPKVKITLAEFAEMDPPEDARFKLDLIDGEIVEVPGPTFEHNRLILRIGSNLIPFVESRSLGEVSTDILVLFDPEAERSYAPDLVFLAIEHLDRLREGKIWGAPDLVVEVLSPSTSSDDRGSKFIAYESAGVPWYWIVDPVLFLIEEYRLTPDGYLRSQTILRGQSFRPGLFPELEINLDWIRS